jgi:hypothetical protein
LTPFPGLNRHSCIQGLEQEQSHTVDILHKVGIKSSSPEEFIAHTQLNKQEVNDADIT